MKTIKTNANKRLRMWTSDLKVRPDMLFEPVSYRGSLPFELTFLNIGEENKHCHREI